MVRCLTIIWKTDRFTKIHPMPEHSAVRQAFQSFKYLLVFFATAVVHNHQGHPFFSGQVNLGKGRALKDAFNYVLVNYPETAGVVTADSDGQHSFQDIRKCMSVLEENPHDLILGCRVFDGEDVPWNAASGSYAGMIIGITAFDTEFTAHHLPTYRAPGKMSPGKSVRFPDYCQTAHHNMT